MSITLSLYAVPANVVPALVKKPAFAEEMLGDPDAFGVEEFFSEYDLDYRTLKEVAKGKKWLTKALSDSGAKVGDDFGYGPGVLFSAEDVAKIARGLAGEWKKPEGPLVDLLDFYEAAAGEKKAVLVIAT